MENQIIDQYFIFRDTNTDRIYLEHMHAGKYQMIKDWINKERIIYQTGILTDPKLAETGEKEIIWDRHATILSKHLRKIMVTFNPDNYYEMENEYRQKKFKMDAAAVMKKAEVRSITNMFIPEDADEMTAMRQWKYSGFITPPPDRITEIKRTFRTLSWKQFKAFIDVVV